MVKVPCKITLEGDKDCARDFIGAAQSQLRILENEMSFQKLKQGVRRVRLNPKIIVGAIVCFNLREVVIYCMPSAGKEKERIEELTEIYVLAGVGGGSRRVLRSVDKGEEWERASGIPGDPYTDGIHSFACFANGICLAGPSRVDASVRMYKSIDSGLNWQAGQTLSGEESVRSIAYLGKGICIAGTRLVGSSFGSLVRSIDSGDHWIAVSTDSVYRSVINVENGIALAATDYIGGHINRSTDYGLTWNVVLAPPRGPWSLVYLEDGICLAGANGQDGSGDGASIFRSTDYGLTWTDLGPLRPTVQEVAYVSTLTYCGNGICLAGGGLNRAGNPTLLFRSTDYGLTWSCVVLSIYDWYIASLLCIEDGICLAGTGEIGRILRSTDYGLTWADTGDVASVTTVWALAKSEITTTNIYKDYS